MSDESPFSKAAIDRALEKLEDVPENEAAIGAVVQGNDVGITGYISKDIGKPGGWDVAAEGTWMRRTGAKLAGLFRWRGKK